MGIEAAPGDQQAVQPIPESGASASVQPTAHRFRPASSAAVTDVFVGLRAASPGRIVESVAVELVPA